MGEPGDAASQVARLLDAVLLVAGDLDLDVVLHRVVEAACSLVQARYGALGVIDEESGGLSSFVHQGIAPVDAERIGSLPTGVGILGLVIEEPAPLRLERLSEHPASHGFPDHHPPMESFLGVPIRIGDRVFGNLYLTEKVDGSPFSAADEELIVGLAAVAGSAIHDARRFEELQQRERWRAAVHELSRVVLEGAPSGEVRRLVAERGARLVDADVAVVVEFARHASGQRLRVVGAHGPWLEDDVLDAPDSAAWRALQDGSTVRSAHGSLLSGPVMWVPVSAGTDVVAALGVGRATVFSAAEEHLLEQFAAQTSLVWTYERAQAEVRRLSMVEDRERIGRDLHDTVIQRLFATGLSLQAGMGRLEGLPDVAERIERAVDEIDRTVKEIRSSIFALQWDRDDAGEGLRSSVLRVVDELGGLLPSDPRVRFDGPIDSVVGREVVEQVIPVVRESLTNVAKHAQAAQVQVVLEVDAGILVLRVTDDGVGMPDAPRGGFGLTNLRERATRLGGECAVTPGPDGGTVLVWRVPVD
ncbi:MAG: GAF domain-containing sensor histidine kinase [Nitriliruptoraceae bacterium]